MTENTDAVYYRTEDYIGTGSRLAIDFIDAFVALVISLAVAIGVSALPVEGGWLTACAVAAVWFSYFVLLKRSRFRTLGYIAGKARIVNLQGLRPSILSLLFRLLFVAGGPFNFLIDLLWIPSDPCRQALRDKLAHTFVVRNSAVPAGPAKLRYTTYTILGTTVLFQEVTPVGPKPAP